MLLITILLVLGYTQSVLCTATLTLPDVSNCDDQAVLTCTAANCSIGYLFRKDESTILNQAGLVNMSYVNKYSSTVTSGKAVKLNIRNIELSDTGIYSCNCGYDQSPRRTLQYQCKARTSTPSVTGTKQLSITVDRLYPQPSFIDIVLTSYTTQVPGNYTCESSPTFASHYRCTWLSTASLPDGNHSYTISVTMGAQVTALSGSFRIATATSPTISNLANINSRLVLRGIQDTLLIIKCASGGGIPAPTLAWYRGNMNRSPLVQSRALNSIQESDGSYTVTLAYSFTPSRADDMMTMSCRAFYPGASNTSSPDPTPASALLYLDLKPESPLVSQTGEAISGGITTLRCTSTNGRPAPSITWFYKGMNFTHINNSSYDQTSETYTVVSVLQRPVGAVDNGQTATCRVLHTTLSVPLTNTIIVGVKFGPANTSIYGNLATPATGDSKIQLNCTSGSSNPASNITWYNGSDVISSDEGNSRWSGDNNGIITSNNLTITPTRYMDGDRIACETGNGFGNDSNYVNLDILYSPHIQLPTNKTFLEGEPYVLLTCLASSKPPATFTWYKGDTVLANGTGTNKDNSFSYVIPLVNRTDAGTYKCQASNKVGYPDSTDVHLYVKHPPNVIMSTTALPPIYTITCTAKGYPESYTYRDWVQVWPGYGTVATIPFYEKTLTLNDVTYEWSGVYACAASNGIAVYGTDLTFTKGNVSIVIKAPPVLTDHLSPDGARFPVAGRLGHNATTAIKYWSNVDGSVVRCYKHVGDSRSFSSRCSVTETDTEVTLPVHNHTVKETGTLATIKIHISSQEDMAAYDVVVSNMIGESVLGIVVIPQGPPTSPTIIGNFSIKLGEVILTVLPGFHGGYNQTLVVQISTDLKTWINKTTVHVGQDTRPIDIHLVNLHRNMLHYIRVFAYNIDGGSELSIHLNFTTIEEMLFAAGQTSGAMIAGVVVGVCVPVLIGVTLVIIWRLRRGSGKHSKKKDTRNIATNSEHADTVVECAMYVSAGVVQSGPSTGDLYSKPQKKAKPQVSSDVYAVVHKQKKDMYENTPESFENGDKKVPKNPKAAKRSAASRPKKNLRTDGLVYAELEFNNNPERSVIHGVDDATLYVQVDFTKAADPLPDSDNETSAEK